MYSTGRLQLTRNGTRFTLEGDVFPQSQQIGDHFQLLYEALEIAANSADKYALDFRQMCNEVMAQSESWAD